jgi:hypothetical protein
MGNERGASFQEETSWIHVRETNRVQGAATTLLISSKLIIQAAE